MIKKPMIKKKKRTTFRPKPGESGEIVGYKDVEALRKYLTPSSKLMSRRRSGCNAQQQNKLKAAVKRARFLALIPYSGT